MRNRLTAHTLRSDDLQVNLWPNYTDDRSDGRNWGCYSVCCWAHSDCAVDHYAVVAEARGRR